MNRVFDREFKVGVVRRIEAGEAIAALSRELGIKREVLYRWKYAVQQRGAEGLRGVGRPQCHQSCKTDPLTITDN